MNEELRWQQRFENYKKAFIQFQTAVRQYKERGLNDLEKQGLIQTFEYTFELAWNLLRDYFIYQGIPEIRGSRDAIRLGLKYGIIENGEIWFQMISARNLTVHTYNEKIIEELLKEIVDTYYEELMSMEMEVREFGLSKETIEKLIDTFRKEAKIEKAILYGSRAKGNFTKGSDIDITIVAPEMTFPEYLHYFLR